MPHRIDNDLLWCDEHDQPVARDRDHCRKAELWWVTDRRGGNPRAEWDCSLVSGRFVRCLHSQFESCEAELVATDGERE